MAAVAAAWFAAPPESPPRRLITQVALLGVIASAPDLDLLFNRHSAETHSIGAALIAGGVSTWLRLPVARTRARIFLAAFLAWFTHPVLDALGTDDSLPLGVMIWWPFSTTYFYANWEVFGAISRRMYRDDFVSQNVLAILRELVILAPFTIVAWWVTRRRRA